MYSTPGISHSSFSIGLVTRSSTSRAEAPGICTKTSIIGTMICGSSSRGSFHTAKAPSSNEPAITSGVSLESIQAWANFPAGPSFRSAFTAGPPLCAPSARPGGTGKITFSPALRPESTSIRSLILCPAVISRVRATPFSAARP